MKKVRLPNGDNIYTPDRITSSSVYDEIYRKNEYIQRGIVLHDGDVVFDVGANIGLFSRYISEQAKGLRILAFEPVPIIYKALELNVKNIPANITTYNVGLGERSETVDIDYFPRVSCDSSIVPFDWDLKVDQYTRWFRKKPVTKYLPERFNKAIAKRLLKWAYKGVKTPVQIRPLSNYLQENHLDHLDLLKLDAENYEKQVLAGLLSDDWDKIRQISMEVHTHIKGGENLLDELTAMLRDKDFTVEVRLDSAYGEFGAFMAYAVK
ncbi:MAG TPA: FkbM family methyltransferase [Candidatus Lokiarchaeia archaeon]|nr:FkbM family methyltransferase [Candidatus Lokiarchaeia archaeon]